MAMKKLTTDKLTTEQKTALLTGASYWRSASVDGAVRSVRFSDGPSGVRAQGKRGDYLGLNGSFPATCFPAHSALACSWNKNLCKEVSARIAGEAKFFGVDVLLAPDINVKRNPLCGRNFEYFSEDAYLNGKLGAAYADGLRENGVGACLKHFAVNNREFGRMVCDSVVDMRTLREIYLTGFEIAVKESSPATVMTAYNRLNGVYCNENSFLINDVLRGEWGFDGAVISDWGGTHDRVAAIKAGADLEMPSCEISPAEIKCALNSGALSAEDVDACAQRIINLSKKVTPKRADCDFEEHAAFAEQAAAECAVLLKNDGILPLKEGVKVALVGEFAKTPLIQGGGSATVNPKIKTSLLSCLSERICGFAEGYSGKDEKRSPRREKKALKLCAEADAVVYCMGLPAGDLEAVDRKNLFLPENQTELLNRIYALGKKVIVALFCGCVTDTEWDKNASALLYAGLGGQGSARAVADVLTGKINPSGKLCETFPVKLSDVPSCEYFNSSPYFTLYGEGMNVGYRYFCDRPEKVKYPFGFGLSYTEFVYSSAKITAKGISFTLKNAGERDGAEAVQLYVRYPDGARAPSLQLKGFEKVFLRAGESARVFIPFDGYTFRSYDAENSRWVEVTGKYNLYIGASSADMRLVGVVKRVGACTEIAPPKTENLFSAGYPVERDEKGRVIADARTPFCELKACRGAFGRVFAHTVLYCVRGKYVVYGSMQYLPLRTLAQFAGFKQKTLDALLLAFNGKLLKGISKFLSREKK